MFENNYLSISNNLISFFIFERQDWIVLKG